MDVPVGPHLPHKTTIDRDVPPRPRNPRRAYGIDEWDKPGGDNKTSGKKTGNNKSSDNKTSDSKSMPF